MMVLGRYDWSVCWNLNIMRVKVASSEMLSSNTTYARPASIDQRNTGISKPRNPVSTTSTQTTHNFIRLSVCILELEIRSVRMLVIGQERSVAATFGMAGLHLQLLIQNIGPTSLRGFSLFSRQIYEIMRYAVFP